MSLDVSPVAATGVWLRHVPGGGDPAYRANPPASGRWQRGSVIAAVYLASDVQTCWTEWYRRLAEDGLEPNDALPRDLYRFAVTLDGVAALDTGEGLARVGLPAAAPPRSQWPTFQDVGEQLWHEGFTGVLYGSAARPDGRALCVFRPGGALPGHARGASGDPPPRTPDAARGMRT